MKQPVSPDTIALEGPFTHRFIHTRGIRLHAATAGDPSHPLVLLIHGTFGAWVDYRYVIEPLADRGFHVAAVDMRGYGMSDKPPARPGDDTLLATGDVDGLITALGHSRAHIVGHDTGGAVGWVYAAAYPARVASLISVSAAHPHDMRRAMRRRPWQLLYMLTRVGVGRLPGGLLRSQTWALPGVWRRELRINTASAFHETEAFDEALVLRVQAARIDHAFRGIVRNTRMLTPKLVSLPAGDVDGNVGAPVLLIHPQQQVWEGIDALAYRRSTGPTQHLTVPGTKNVPHIEAPESFTAAVADFIASVPPHPE